MKKNIKRMLAWLEADYAMKDDSRGRKAWLTKAIGINGQNQTKGAIRTLKYIIKRWEE